MADRMVVDGWIDDEYESRFEGFAIERGVSPARVRRAFRDHCETFQGQVMDDTSPDVVRRLAHDKLKWHTPDGRGGREQVAEE